ncbi:LysR family transcriptional regulator [Paraburkholderia sp. Tr-20389]|uniref:LysR substrate-binding domain-containing protein n=1 Tax=Paraburkholderia sp. Tr-20389 TaxID=2703903 RepID=UPI0019800EA8|nr:LysR substrate-binding domain-containing protein [Paraburkholderia sp. Tr-20389]MBN3755277.1 LysR family transcriptional regulator [Paraburkholderia sp. Tr-20389]
MSTFNARRLSALPPLETLMCFEAVARLGSFTRAAHELSITQSAASKQIRTLETLLGCSLFERHTRALKLNESGLRLFGELRPLLSRLQHTISRVRDDDERDAISVVCTHAVAQYWLLPRLADFIDRFPAVSIDVKSTNSINEKLCAEYAFGILYGEGEWKSLESAKLFPEIVYPVYSVSGYTKGIPGTLGELAQAPLIHLDSSEWDCLDWKDWFAQLSFDYTPTPSLIFNQTALVYEAAQRGLGIGLGWDFIVSPAIQAGTLSAIPDMSLITGRHDYLVHPRGKSLNVDEIRFRDWLIESV